MQNQGRDVKLIGINAWTSGVSGESVREQDERDATTKDHSVWWACDLLTDATRLPRTALPIATSPHRYAGPYASFCVQPSTPYPTFHSIPLRHLYPTTDVHTLPLAAPAYRAYSSGQAGVCLAYNHSDSRRVTAS